jgi:hypothetical protein
LFYENCVGLQNVSTLDKSEEERGEFHWEFSDTTALSLGRAQYKRSPGCEAQGRPSLILMSVLPIREIAEHPMIT